MGHFSLAPPTHLLHWNDGRGPLLLHKKDEKLRGVGVARILRDTVDVLGRFIKRLAWSQRYRVPAFDLHDDGAFQDIDKGVRVVPMLAGRGARRILDREHYPFLARESRQILPHERDDLGSLCHDRSREKTEQTDQRRVCCSLRSHHAGFLLCRRIISETCAYVWNEGKHHC